jgi:hypothetical protein
MLLNFSRFYIGIVKILEKNSLTIQNPVHNGEAVPGSSGMCKQNPNLRDGVIVNSVAGFYLIQ